MAPPSLLSKRPTGLYNVILIFFKFIDSHLNFISAEERTFSPEPVHGDFEGHIDDEPPNFYFQNDYDHYKEPGANPVDQRDPEIDVRLFRHREHLKRIPVSKYKCSYLFLFSLSTHFDVLFKDASFTCSLLQSLARNGSFCGR